MTPAEKLAKTTQAKRKQRNVGRPGIHRCAVRQIRQALGITLNASAKSAGISPAGLSAIERGADVTLSTMKKLSHFYGKGFDELWPKGTP